MRESTFTANQAGAGGAVIDPRLAEKLEAQQLGVALRVLRVRAGLTRQEAGDRVGMTPEGWAKYERGSPGIFRPSVRSELVVKALGLPVSALSEEHERVIAANTSDARP